MELKEKIMENNLSESLRDKVRRQESEIFQLKAELKLFLDMPGYVYCKSADSLYTFCNERLAQEIGLTSPEKIKGKEDNDFEWSKVLSEKFIVGDSTVIHSGEELVSVFETQIKRKDGSNTWLKVCKSPVKIKGRVVGVITTGVDITEEYSNCKKALLGKQFAEDIIYNLPGIIYWKNKESQYIGFNRNVVTLSGLDRNQLKGKKDTELNWGDKESERFIREDKKVIETGKTLVTRNQIPIKNSDGKLMVLKTEKSRLEDRNGDIFGVLAVAVDITDQDELEKRLIEEKNKSEQVNVIKTEFIRNIEHDIRTPLSGIWGMTNYLWEKEENEVKKEYLNDVLQSSKELLSYCNSILDFSKAEYGGLSVINEKFDLKNLVKSIEKIEGATVKHKNLQLKISYDTNIPPALTGDQQRVYRILLNLVSNAVKFTKNGYVQLKASLIRRDKHSALIRFIIEDTGIGIPEDKKEYIFEKFSRLSLSNKGIYKGAGLGLGVVKKFMHEINGEIDLVTKVGRGSQFICTVPFAIPLTNDFVKEYNQW